MRFVILVRAHPDSEAQTRPDADPAVMAEMAAYHQQLAEAGVLLDGNGLRPSRDGWRIEYGADGSRRVVDGPFAEVKELIAGYTVIQVPSREAAMEWARRFPSPFGRQACAIEVRPLYELEDFQPGEGLDTFRRLYAEQPPGGER